MICLMKTDFAENELVVPKEQNGAVDPNALPKEVYRAMEMMKRVKKTSVAQFDATETQSLPSYLIPDAILLCPSGGGFSR